MKKEEVNLYSFKGNLKWILLWIIQPFGVRKTITVVNRKWNINLKIKGNLVIDWIKISCWIRANVYYIIISWYENQKENFMMLF